MCIDIYHMVIGVLPQTKTLVFSIFSPVHEDIKKNVTREKRVCFPAGFLRATACNRFGTSFWPFRFSAFVSTSRLFVVHVV